MPGPARGHAGGASPDPHFRISLLRKNMGNALFPTVLRHFQQIVWCTGLESLTKQFEQRIAEFLRRTQLTPSEFGERAIGDRKFYGDVRPGRSPRLATVDRVLAFMEAYEGAAHGARGSTGSESLGDSSSTAGETER